MAKLAYLVLAHANPQHLRRLLAALASDAAACFVHLDAKTRAAEFDALRGPRVRFARERVAVHWGDYSVVEATLRLLRLALADPARFDRFVLLSGADYPLRSAAAILRFFDAQREAEFLELLPMPCEAKGKPLTRLSVYQHPPNASRLARELRRALVRLRIVSKRRDPQAALRGLAPYAGSQWWALSREACEYCVDFVAREPWLARFYRNTHCPDESFIHTVLGNSRFARQARPPLTFADWSAGGRNPAQIGEPQLARLEADASRWLFARKFDDASEALVARLDRLRVAR